MTVFERRSTHMPSLGGATEWLNSEPLGPAELRGHVVLVNFWTLTCINWLRPEPYVRAWSQAYRDDGLVVIGVHTPEFSFEHEIDLVRRATKDADIDYPVAVDNDYAIWSAFDNHYWPALYFVDADGVIRDHHFGEGRYEQSERVIQQLLGVERELVSVEGARRGGGGRLGPPAHARDVSRLRARRHSRAVRGVRTPRLRVPVRLAQPLGARPASGRSGRRTSCSTRPAGASPSGSTRATRISCCRAEPRADPVPRAPRRRGSGPVTRRRRRRGRQRRAPGRPPVPARARARRGPRADAGDHVPRARRRGVRVHVRVAALPAKNWVCPRRTRGDRKRSSGITPSQGETAAPSESAARNLGAPSS